MSEPEIFITNPFELSANSFYPRKYDPKFLFVKEGMANSLSLSQYIVGEIKGGSTPPAHLFFKEKGIPFIKTSAVSRHYINVNDLQKIDSKFHNTAIRRSITKPYDVIYTMTGKFMGKAAMCPATIHEMNMSQNSVVLHTKTPLQAAFLTIFLNSKINRIQVRGTYSITKQKFMNQGKISNLKVIQYHSKYDSIMQQYVNAYDRYYAAVSRIQLIISQFNTEHRLSYVDKAQYGFMVNPQKFEKQMLTPNYYRSDIHNTIHSVLGDGPAEGFDIDRLKKGDEIGSPNYLETGIPFIKTSDIINYGVDYEPDCYCPWSFLSQLNQDIHKGDIIFAKDGKPGEVAIILESNQIVISSGLVRYRPRDNDERYWLFLLLASKYGEAYFKKWFVVASTMLHLRADFFRTFKIPIITDEIKKQYIIPLAQAFQEKADCFNTLDKIKTLVEASFTNQNQDLSLA